MRVLRSIIRSLVPPMFNIRHHLCLVEDVLINWAKAVVSLSLGSSDEQLQAIHGWQNALWKFYAGAEDARLLCCISQSLHIVVAQVAVSDKTNEITKVDDLLEGLVLWGKVMIGDALLTQRAISESFLRRGGDYLFGVKDNHPQLLEDIDMSFADYWWIRDTISEGSLIDQHGN